MPRELFHKGVKSEGYSTEGDEWIPRGFLLMHIVVHVVSKAIRVSKKAKAKLPGFINMSCLPEWYMTRAWK